MVSKRFRTIFSHGALGARNPVSRVPSFRVLATWAKSGKHISLSCFSHLHYNPETWFSASLRKVRAWISDTMSQYAWHSCVPTRNGVDSLSKRWRKYSSGNDLHTLGTVRQSRACRMLLVTPDPVTFQTSVMIIIDTLKSIERCECCLLQGACVTGAQLSEVIVTEI